MTREPSPCHDAETKLYYLQSRYYNPEMGRFINADVTVSTGQRFAGCNMYCYCLNNPSNYLDSEGTDAVWIHEDKNPSGTGHTGLLVEKEDGKWYFFYWGRADGNAGRLKTIFGTAAKLVWVEIETDGYDLTNTEDVCAVFDQFGDTDMNRSQNITGTLYLIGDYSMTVNFIKKLQASVESNRIQYSIAYSNCTQISVLALSVSNFDLLATYSPVPALSFLKAVVISVTPKYQKVVRQYTRSFADRAVL